MHKIKWPNSLKNSPQWSRQLSQPTLRREGDARLAGCVFHERNTRGVATNVYLRKTSEKTGKDAIYELLVKGSGVVFTHGEGISTPHARPKGRQPLIKCAKYDFDFYVPFYVLISFIPFLYFFLFCGRQGCFPLLLRSPQFGMRKSDLRSSFGTKCLV